MDITLDKAAHTRPAGAKWRQLTGQALKYVLLLLSVAVFIVPMFWMLSASLKDLQEIYTFPPEWIPAVPRWSNYVEAWNAAPFGRFYVNTIITTTVGVAAEVILGTMTAYAFVYLPFPGKELLFLVLLGALMVPIHVTILPNYLTVARLGWLNTYAGIIVPGASAAFGTFLLRQHFMTLPREVLEAARIEGASHLQLLTRIVLPISRSMLVTVGLIALVNKWNDFLWPLIVTNQTRMRVLPVGLAYLYQQEGTNQWGIIMAATIFVVLPILLIFIWAQRHIIAGLTAGATKG
ncbi:MAG TPA: carbohydrate ABC transporter permease [Herpetosiphonaceae bacterium]|nr:carbohydrate ABC transporter permease [Herpetosiphonaceae bacterium]